MIRLLLLITLLVSGCPKPEPPTPPKLEPFIYPHTAAPVDGWVVKDTAITDGEGFLAALVGDFGHEGFVSTMWVKDDSVNWYASWLPHRTPLNLTVDTILGYAATKGDIDGDGDWDLIIPDATGGTGSDPGPIYWFENPCDPAVNSVSPNFAWKCATGDVGQDVWTKTEIIDLGGEVNTIHAADFDQDGLTDIAARKDGGSIGIIRQTAANVWSPIAATAIGMVTTGGSGSGFLVYDIDEDGYPDIIGEGKIAINPEPGLPFGLWSNWSEYTVDGTNVGTSFYADVGDIDGDGKLDIAFSDDNDVYWYEQGASLAAWTARAVETGVEADDTIGIMVQDVNLDNYKDVGWVSKGSSPGYYVAYNDDMIGQTWNPLELASTEIGTDPNRATAIGDWKPDYFDLTGLVEVVGTTVSTICDSGFLIADGGRGKYILGDVDLRGCPASHMVLSQCETGFLGDCSDITDTWCDGLPAAPSSFPDVTPLDDWTGWLPLPTSGGDVALPAMIGAEWASDRLSTIIVGQGTGTIIGPNTVLTAQHVVLPPNGNSTLRVGLNKDTAVEEHWVTHSTDMVEDVVPGLGDTVILWVYPALPGPYAQIYDVSAEHTNCLAVLQQGYGGNSNLSQCSLAPRELDANGSHLRHSTNSHSAGLSPFWCTKKAGDSGGPIYAVLDTGDVRLVGNIDGGSPVLDYPSFRAWVEANSTPQPWVTLSNGVGIGEVGHRENLSGIGTVQVPSWENAFAAIYPTGAAVEDVSFSFGLYALWQDAFNPNPIADRLASAGCVATRVSSEANIWTCQAKLDKDREWRIDRVTVRTVDGAEDSVVFNDMVLGAIPQDSVEYKHLQSPGGGTVAIAFDEHHVTENPVPGSTLTSNIKTNGTAIDKLSISYEQGTEAVYMSLPGPRSGGYITLDERTQTSQSGAYTIKEAYALNVTGVTRAWEGDPGYTLNSCASFTPAATSGALPTSIHQTSQLEFWVRPSVANQGGYIAFSDVPITDITKARGGIRFNTSGSIDVYDGGAWSRQQTANYTPNEWHQVRINGTYLTSTGGSNTATYDVDVAPCGLPLSRIQTEAVADLGRNLEGWTYYATVAPTGDFDVFGLGDTYQKGCFPTRTLYCSSNEECDWECGSPPDGCGGVIAEAPLAACGAGTCDTDIQSSTRFTCTGVSPTLVASVENIDLITTLTGEIASATLTKTPTALSVPFLTQDQPNGNGGLKETQPDIYFGGTGAGGASGDIIMERDISDSETINGEVTVVTFNPAEIDVHTGRFHLASGEGIVTIDSTCTGYDASPAPNVSNCDAIPANIGDEAFPIFYSYQHSGSGAFGTHLIRGDLTAGTGASLVLTRPIVSGDGTADGHYYIVDYQGAGTLMSVQEVSGTIAASSATEVINTGFTAVDETKTFLVGSWEISADTIDTEDGSLAVTASDETGADGLLDTVTLTRASATATMSLTWTGYLVTVDDGTFVERGTFATTGSNTDTLTLSTFDHAIHAGNMGNTASGYGSLGTAQEQSQARFTISGTVLTGHKNGPLSLNLSWEAIDWAGVSR